MQLTEKDLSKAEEIANNDTLYGNSDNNSEKDLAKLGINN